ncbi:linear amide C-N hydrolase [Sulfurimonas paralvinellae]|uniref:Choloylglycine hydrolase family protein n=1 Tax=Sulfurimonas paralvinellae TaxID=317658 RepID=A0A7M1B5X5_9BACT|nr:choloylglycine hydrolase family protein [Sulfurimonas paralvinellae]QOP45139.1 choloylglycine hydrolase family protein [Sulfurimonas paralvinellae]
MNFKKKTLGLIAIAVTTFGISTANACTGAQIITEDKAAINGRTVEFGVLIDTSVAFVPRGYKFTGMTTKGPGKTWRAKYASVGMIIADYDVIVDGMNEKGLVCANFYFPGFAKYSVTTKENQSISMSTTDMVQWILSMFDNVDDVKKALKNNEVAISPVLTPGFPPQVQPFHFIVYDAAGKSIVFEPIDGKLKVYDNPIGVITNSPTFDWHMMNLRNYVTLGHTTPHSKKIFGIELKPLGQGAGMLGLPGDFTPPSRFVRAAAFAGSTIPAKTAEGGVMQMFHILNSFDIPVGAARTVEAGKIYSDYTMLTVVRDTKNLRFYYKTYDDQNIKMVDMKKFDFNAKKIVKLHTLTKQKFEDVSKKLK